MAEISNTTSKQAKDHHHYRDCFYTIESAREELIKAKERVQELENIIIYLQQENIDNVDQPEKNEEGENPPKSTSLFLLSSSLYDGPIQGNTLQVTMSYLCIKDILSCNQVCKQWNLDISKNYLIWKHAAINHSPTFMEHMIAKEQKMKKKQSDDDDDDDSPNYVSYYKNIALGLIYDPCISRDEAVDDDEDIVFEPPKPKLSSKDVILLIDATDDGPETIVASWSKNLSDFKRNGKVEIFTRADTELHTFLPQWAQEDHFKYRAFSYTARCFRCDTGQSICWMFGQMPDDDWGNKAVMSPVRRPTCTAVAAKDLWWHQRYIFMDCRMDINISRVLPSDVNGNESEAAYKLDEMSFAFRAMSNTRYLSEVDWYGFKNMDEILLSLEGLVWK